MIFINQKIVEKEKRNNFVVYFVLRIRAIVYIILAFVIFSIALANTTPFGAGSTYTLYDKTMKPLSPPARVEVVTIDGTTLTKIKENLVYFTTKLPYQFDTAIVKIKFKLNGEYTSLSLGYKDRDTWHYNTQIMDMPFFHTGEWLNLGDGPVLYQKTQDWKSVKDFLNNFKANSTIGTIDYSLPKETIILPNYEARKANTVIDTPLRGRHTMYAYLKDEPFYLKVTKRDLNWYEDPDVLEISVYKDDVTVFSAEIDDDGIVDASKATGISQELEIKNPGPGLPETGVYKIVFDGDGDTVITNIETNLHKIVFSSPIYPINNAEVYPGIAQKTDATSLYISGSSINVVTNHTPSLQNLIINGSSTPLTALNISQVITFPASSTLSRIEIPKSDVTVSGKGYYAFSEDQFFTPTSYNQISISSNKDAELTDYIMFGHKPYSITLDGYYEVEREFDLSNAVTDKNGLSWLIRANGLKENGGEIIIKDIEVTYSKKGWWYNK